MIQVQKDGSAFGSGFIRNYYHNEDIELFISDCLSIYNPDVIKKVTFQNVTYNYTDYEEYTLLQKAAYNKIWGIEA